MVDELEELLAELSGEDREEIARSVTEAAARAEARGRAERPPEVEPEEERGFVRRIFGRDEDEEQEEESGFFGRLFGDDEEEVAVEAVATEVALAERRAGRPPAPGEIDPYESLVRLLVGAASEGSDFILQRIRRYEEARGHVWSVELEAEYDLLRQALIGYAFSVADILKSTFLVTSNTIGVVEGFGAFAAKGLFRVWPLSEFRDEVAALLPTRESVEEWAVRGQEEEDYARALARYVLDGTVDDVLGYVGNKESVGELVEDVAGDYMGHLEAHPEELDGVVRSVADRYLGYLNEHPDEVLDLIQTQTLSLSAEIRDEVRTVAVSIDSVLEMLVRRLFRRDPRDTLPGPPPEVLSRAEVLRPELEARRAKVYR